MADSVRTWVRVHTATLVLSLVVILGLGSLLVACGLNSNGGGGFASGPTVITLTKASGDGQVGTPGRPLPLPLVAQVTDQSGNPLFQVPVDFLVTSGGGSVAATVAPTNSAGLAQTTMVLGPAAGTNRVVASVGSPTVASVTFSETGGAGGGGGLTIFLSGLPSRIVVGTPGTIVVTVRDATGATFAGYTGTVKFTSTDPLATLPAPYTFTAADAGTHSFSVTLNSFGTWSITVTDNSVPPLTATLGSITAASGPATQYFVTGIPAALLQGSPSDVTVTAADAKGFTDAFYTGTVKFTSTDLGAGVVLPASYTFTLGDAGVHKFPLGVTLQTVGAQTVTATDASKPSITGFEAFTVTAAVRVLTLTATPSPISVKGTATVSWTHQGGPDGVALTSSNVAAKAESIVTPGTDTVTVPFTGGPPFEDPFAFYRLAATKTATAFAKETPEITGATQVFGSSATTNAVAAFNDGSYVTTGFFSGTTTFGQPNTGGPTLTATGSSNAFVARYNANNTLAWVVQDTGGGPNAGQAVATFPDGSLVVAGFFSGTATFGTAPPLVSSGGKDAFVVRYKSDGTVAWAKKAGGTTDDIATGIGTFSDGTLIVAGYYASPTATFAVGKTITNAGGNDVFVARYAADGTLVWVKTGGGTGDDFAFSMATTADFRAVVTGSFTGSATFGATTVISGAGGTATDAFVASYNSDGTVGWVKQLQSSTAVTNQGNGIAAYNDGSCAVTGTYNGTATFVGTATVLTSLGASDAFVARYDPLGKLGFGISGGGSGADQGVGVGVQADGTLVVTGAYSGTATFSGSPLTSAGGKDVFVCRYNGATGALIWAASAGGSSDESGLGAAGLPDGSALVVGSFSSSSVTAGPGVGLSLAGGAPEGFLFRYSGINYKIVELRPTGFSRAIPSSEIGSSDTVNTTAVASFPDGSFVATGHYAGGGTVAFGSFPSYAMPATAFSGGFSFFCPSFVDAPFIVRSQSDGTVAWYAWASTTAGSGSNYCFSQSVATFPDGSCIISGAVNQSPAAPMTFFSAGGAAGVTLASVDTGFFVAKYSQSGTCTNAFFYGGGAFPASVCAGGAASTFSVCAFVDGKYAVSGPYTTTFTFPSGGKSLPAPSGSTDAFVAHFTAADVNDWVATGGGSSMITNATTIAGFPDGSCVSAGTFNDGGAGLGSYSVSFGATTLSDTTGTTTPTDGFFAKYDSSGTLTYAVGSITGSTTISTSLLPAGAATYSDGTCVIGGNVTSTQKFSGKTMTSSGGTQNPFVIKLDKSGAATFANVLTDTSFCTAFGVCSYADGSSIICGTFSGTLTFGGGVTATSSFTAPFLGRYDTTGAALWAKLGVPGSSANGKGVAGWTDQSVVLVGDYSFSTLLMGTGEPAATTLPAPTFSGTAFYMAKYFNY